MLFATYQPYPENEIQIPEDDVQRRYYEDTFGFNPYWCMPVTSMSDFFVHSIFTAPNCGERLLFLESEEYVRIDKVKHYQAIKDGHGYRLDGCVNASIDDKHSEFLVPKSAKMISEFPIAGIEQIAEQVWISMEGESPFMGQSGSGLIALLKKYASLHYGIPPEFASLEQWAASMDMTVSEFQYRLYLERGKLAFETVLLPTVVKKALGEETSIYDVQAIEPNFHRQRILYEKFARWSYDDCTLQGYDEMYEEMKRLVIDNPAVCQALAEGKKPGRNDLCPCGSGKKWKKCHGKNI